MVVKKYFPKFSNNYVTTPYYCDILCPSKHDNNLRFNENFVFKSVILSFFLKNVSSHIKVPEFVQLEQLHRERTVVSQN